MEIQAIIQDSSGILVFGCFCACLCLLYHSHFILNSTETNAGCENFQRSCHWQSSKYKTTCRKGRTFGQLFPGWIIYSTHIGNIIIVFITISFDKQKTNLEPFKTLGDSFKRYPESLFLHSFDGLKKLSTGKYGYVGVSYTHHATNLQIQMRSFT